MAVAGMLAFNRDLSALTRSKPAAVAGMLAAARPGISAAPGRRNSFTASGRQGDCDRGAGTTGHHDQHHDQDRLSSRFNRRALGIRTIVHAAIVTTSHATLAPRSRGR